MIAVRKFGQLLEEKPIKTKCVTAFFTFGLGDYLCQKINPQKDYYEYKRTLSQASFGFLMAPYFHLQFNVIIPYLFPPEKKFSIIKSVLYGQTVSASIAISLFFTYSDLVNGKSVMQVKERLKEKFFLTLFSNWTFWPLVMLINFNFISFNWRVIFANTCGLFWNIYLSYIQNKN